MSKKVKTLVASLMLVLALSSCSATQVTQFYALRGQTIDRQTAVYVADAINAWQRQNALLLQYLAALDQNLVTTVVFSSTFRPGGPMVGLDIPTKILPLSRLQLQRESAWVVRA